MSDYWLRKRAVDQPDATLLALSPLAYFDARMIKGISDGGKIPVFFDRSGMNGHAVARASTLQATYKTAIKNGLPVVRFNGTGNRYSHNLSLNGASTVCGVFQRTGSAQAVQQLISFSAVSTPIKCDLLAKTDATTNWGCYRTAFRVSGVSSLNWVIACITDDGAGTVNMYSNGAASPVATFTSQTYYTDPTIDRRVIGGHSGGEWFGGDMGAGLLFSGVLSAGNLASVFSALNSIWGVY